MTGEEILKAAIDLVREELRRAPQGLTNAEVGRRTGLSLEIPSNKGYISWTILQYLVKQGEVVNDDGRYRLRPQFSRRP